MVAYTVSLSTEGHLVKGKRGRSSLYTWRRRGRALATAGTEDQRVFRSPPRVRDCASGPKDATALRPPPAATRVVRRLIYACRRPFTKECRLTDH